MTCAHPLRDRDRLRKASRKALPLPQGIVCARPECPKTFRPQNTTHRFCSEKCRNSAYHTAGLTDEMRVRKRHPACCKWCRGKHVTDRCPNPSGRGVVKHFGTIGPNREYVPPPGVTVRHVVISNTVNGDTVGEWLKEAKP